MINEGSFNGFSAARDLLPVLRIELDELKKGRSREDQENIDAAFEKLSLVYRRNQCDEIGEFAHMFVQLKDNESIFLGGLSDSLRMKVRHAIHKAFTSVLSGIAPGDEHIAIPDDDEMNGEVSYEYTDIGIDPMEFAGLLDLALATSPREVAKVMKAAGRISPDQEDPLLKLIAKHLEECASVGASPGTIIGYPATVLEIPRVQSVVVHMLRQHVYSCLLKDGVDAWQGSLSQHERTLEKVPAGVDKHLARLLKANGIKQHSVHEEIFGEVRGQFEQYTSLQMPNDLVRELEIKGAMHHTPTLRQRMAVSQGLDRKRILVDFNTGDGKYLVAVLIWRLLNEQRQEAGLDPGQMVYVCPPNVISDLRNRVSPLDGVRDSHEPYFPTNQPTTGAIVRKSQSNGNGIENELETDMVFVSSHLVGRERDEKPIHEHIIDHARQHPVTCLTYDESQNLNGGKEWYRWAAHLTAGLEQTREEGVLVQLSATPITKALSDYYQTLRLLLADESELRELASEEQSTRRTKRVFDPELLNAHSQRFHLRVDEPTDILERVEEVGWEPTQRERFLWKMYIDDSSLGFQEKMAKLALAELDPQLASGDPSIECSLQKRLMDLLESLLEGTIDEKGVRNTILITETYLSRWLLRHPDYVEDDQLQQILIEKLQAFLQRLESAREQGGGKLIHAHVIHGKTDAVDRRKAIADVRAAREHRDSQAVLFAFDKCIETGINLSWVDAVVELESARTQAQREQVLGRVDRENNTEADYFILRAENSLLGTFQDHADSNAGPINRFRRGSGISTAQMRRIENERDEGATVVGSSLQLGTKIAEHLTTVQRKMMRAQGWAQNGGFQRFVNYWGSDPDRVNQWLDLFVRDAQAPEVLTVPEHTRFMAGLLQKLRTDGVLEGNRVLEVHSHALALLRAMRSTGANDWDVESMVMHQLIGSEGMKMMLEEGLEEGYAPNWFQGLPNSIASACRGRDKYDAIVMPDGLQYSSPPREQLDGLSGDEKFQRMANNQRLQVPVQAWMSLNENGLFIPVLPWYAVRNDELQAYAATLEYSGFKVLAQYSQTGQSKDNRAGDRFWNKVLVCQKQPYSLVDYHQMRRDLWPELEMSSFQFSNIQQWEPQQTGAGKRQCGKPLLLHPLLHHDFGSGKVDFSFPYKPEVREKQLQRLDAVTNAVRKLRSLHEEHSDLRKLPPEALQGLASDNIFACPPPKKQEDSAFSIVLNSSSGTAEYGQFVTPLDKKWDSVVQS